VEAGARLRRALACIWPGWLAQRFPGRTNGERAESSVGPEPSGESCAHASYLVFLNTHMLAGGHVESEWQGAKPKVEAKRRGHPALQPPRAQVALR
jgi:hypothetical protein